jgi:hypothetical protein
MFRRAIENNLCIYDKHEFAKWLNHNTKNKQEYSKASNFYNHDLDHLKKELKKRKKSSFNNFIKQTQKFNTKLAIKFTLISIPIIIACILIAYEIFNFGL